jgi:hypothetical protein
MEDKTTEMEKLYPFDASVVKWLNENSPDIICDFVRDLSANYAQLGISINQPKLLEELARHRGDMDRCPGGNVAEKE